MRILIACEESQAVCIEMRKRGHEAFSCDLESCSGGYPEWHIKDDIMYVMPGKIISLNFLGAHPVCKYIANSGVRWLASKKEIPGFEWSNKYRIFINNERFKKMRLGALFFKSMLSYVKNVGCGYVENPILHKYAMEIIQDKPTQIIQPYHFGHTETKATCLWIVGLPKLKETNNVYNEMMKLDYKDRAKIHYASPGPQREKLRSKTYPRIAQAMAEQWTEDLNQ